LTDEVFASFRLVASGKGIELVNRTDTVPSVLLDEHRFRQILFNLIGNAVKFTPQGSITVSASYADGNLEVSVADTGCGIPADMLTHILDPFVQVQDASHSADRSRGTGLGLSICNRLVKVMGGKLTVESELGKGSKFIIRIPGIVAKDGADAGPKTAAELKNLPKHVLIVDDSPVNRAVLTAFLKRAGVTAIDHAVDGVDALAKLEAAEKSGQGHDFVFSDFWMPNMNGPELVEKLRADSRFNKLPVFALTADTEFHRDARTALFTGILFKPLTYNKLVETLASMDHQ
jgi:CheY-like chemotaxis protein